MLYQQGVPEVAGQANGAVTSYQVYKMDNMTRLFNAASLLNSHSTRIFEEGVSQEPKARLFVLECLP